MIIFLNLLAMVGCAICWAVSIYLILVRRFNNKNALLRYNLLVLLLMLLNLLVCLPTMIWLLGIENAFVLRILLVFATVTNLLSTTGLIFFCLYGLLITHRTLPQEVDDIVILGAATHKGMISPVLASRLQYGVHCWKSNPTAKIIVTGGTVHGETKSEASIMADYLVTRGVPKKQIIQEQAAKNTWQNLQLSAQVISSPVAQVVVVTSNFHVWRVQEYLKQQNSNWLVRGANTPIAHCPLTFVRDYLGNIRDHRKLAGCLLAVVALVCEVILSKK